MPAKKKKQKPGDSGTVTLYDVAADSSRTERRRSTGRYEVKDTLNLCQKEKSRVTAELFVLILAVILAVLCLVEYVGIYRPYLRAENAEAALNGDRAELARLEEKLNGKEDPNDKNSKTHYNAVKDDWNQYNCELIDETLIDRLDVLDLLKRMIFPVGKITSFRIAQNHIDLQLTNVELGKWAEIREELLKEPIVANAGISQTNYNEDTGEGTFSMSIDFKDADQVEKEAKQ